MRPFYLAEHEEGELIEMLNEVDTAWRESYDDPLEAAEDLLPDWLRIVGLMVFAYGDGGTDNYDELDFNEE